MKKNMATAAEYTADQLNYYRICFVATDILVEGLRSIFKQEWDKRYKATLGEWKDEPCNGLDFYNAESPRNQRRNANLLATMINGDTTEWDCTMLFYAILYSDCIGPGLSTVVQSNVDDLRRFRNEEFAHMPQGKLSDADFQNAMGKVHTAFQGLALPTLQIQDVINQTTFPTEELRDILKKVEDLQKELQKTEKQKQGLEDKLNEKEEHLKGIEHQLHEKEKEKQVLEDQLQNDMSPFCILPPKPSHDIAGRSNEVVYITKQLKELKEANENKLSYLYISGNPGSGKSQLAGLVAKRFFDDAQKDPSTTTFVMTLYAESQDTLLESYFSFARQLKCPEYTVTNILQSKDLKTDEKIAHLKTLISAKLECYTSWLLVADNVKSISRMHVDLLEAGNEQWARGQLLITTQDTASIPLPSSFIQHISVKKGMEPDDAISLLAILSGIDDTDMGKVVAQALDYQPLALASAATYVRQLRQSKITSNFGWYDYLEKLERGQRLTTETILAETNPSYPKSMTAATTLAVKETMASDNVINHTFSFLSLCAPQPLSLDIVINYILNADEEIEDKEMIITRIQRCSLLLLEEEDSVVYIGVHQVVRDVVWTMMKDFPESVHHKAVNGAVTAFDQFIDNTLPENQWLDTDTVTQTKRISPHLRAFNISIENLVPKASIPQVIKTGMLKLGRTCQNHCDFNAAKTYYEYSLTIFLERKGPEHVDVAKIYSYLGSVHESLSDFEQAKNYHNQALNIYLIKLGPEHIRVANGFSFLGNAHEALGDFRQAKEYYHQALNIYLKELGAGHVHVATTYSNLGSVCNALGDFEQAKEYHHRDLNIRLKKVGPDHVDVATIYSHLGSVSNALGDFEQSKIYHQRALNIRLKKLGNEHVDVANTYSQLGSVYKALSDFEQAKKYHHLALNIHLKKLGPEHVDVANTYSNLGSFHYALGDFEHSKQYHHCALNIRLKKLGPEHADVANTYSNLGSVYKALNDFNRANDYYHCALNIHLKKLGPEHVDVATTYSNLGSFYYALGDFEQSKKYHYRALNIRLKKLGPEHVHVANTYGNLGSVSNALGDFEQAKEYHNYALKIRLKTLGPDHVYVATTYSKLGSVYAALNDFEQAKEYHRRDLAISLKRLGPEHVDVATTYSHLGSVSSALGDFEQAKEYHHRALNIRLRRLGPEHVDVATTYTHLGSIFNALGDFEQAKEYHHRAISIRTKKLGPEHVHVATTFCNLDSVYAALGDFERGEECHDHALDFRRKKFGTQHVDVPTTLDSRE